MGARSLVRVATHQAAMGDEASFAIVVIYNVISFSPHSNSEPKYGVSTQNKANAVYIRELVASIFRYNLLRRLPHRDIRGTANPDLDCHQLRRAVLPHPVYITRATPGRMGTVSRARCYTRSGHGR